jgi:hypothetical protein
MPKAIFVLSLSHSGSTLFVKLLGTGGRAVGLGELRKLLTEPVASIAARICSCGKPAADCEFWSLVLNRIEGPSLRDDYAGRYRIIAKAVEDKFGPNYFFVDSSKSLTHLRTVRTAVPNLEVMAFHIGRDVRPWSLSILDTRTRKGRWKTVATRCLPELSFNDWYRGNKAIASTTTSMEIQSISVSYEALCLKTDLAISDISRQFGMALISPSGRFGNSNSHILRGNQMARRNDHMIKYDYSWFYRSEWLRPYLLMPWVRALNEKWLRLGDTLEGC